MKLKYYLRGLGIGMLVTALVFVLSGNAGAQMSDAEVKRRAAELGMEEKDKTVLEDIHEAAAGEDAEEAGQPGAPEGDVSGQDAEPADGGTKPQDGAPEQTGGKTPDEGAQGTVASADGGGEAQTKKPEDGTSAAAKKQEAAQQIEKKAAEIADRGGAVAENAPKGRTVTLDVRSGDSSFVVAKKAVAAGLVKSAADFDVFLSQNGYDRRLCIGTYEITEGMSEKEIADIITKSR